MRLSAPIELGPRTAPNRIVFGPHETNLGRGRALSDRHVAYYARRAEGGAGVIVTEEASVHPSDWPYERAPLATECARGWESIVAACRPSGSLVIAALGHAGGQGSSAYNQAPLWAPSRVPEVNTREVPKSMERGDIDAVIRGFGEATRIAVGAGCDGVEVNAGQHSLIRQFLSGLTNQRTDEWGADRLLLARRVLQAVRSAAGNATVGLRLSCDELAPWAGIVPEAAVELAAQLAEHVDYVTVVRGSIFSVSATRPDGHTLPGFNLDLAASVRAATDPRVAVVAQGSIVDVAQAEDALVRSMCDLVEMTRAQIAEPDLAALVSNGRFAEIRPCILCNQTCQVRDARNPIVSCVVEPASGHEWEDSPIVATVMPADVLVVGGGVAGLECARVAATRGHRVTVAEQEAFGGALLAAARGAGRDRLVAVVDWLVGRCAALGAAMRDGWKVTDTDIAGWRGPVVLCTGSLPGAPTYAIDGGARVLSAAEALSDTGTTGGDVAVWDPIGGPIGVSVAERLRASGATVRLVTPDLIAGNELSRLGDLAPANVRLHQAGIVIEKRSVLRRVGAGVIEVEDRFTGERRSITADVVVDAGYRLPDDRLWRASGGRAMRAGDAVAPRSLYEAMLEGRRAGMAVDG